MRAIILAAGRGSRMGALTEDAPKCMVPLAGKPLLEWQIAALRGAGVDAIGIVRGYKGEVFEGRGLSQFDNARWADTNMVASLACAAGWLRDEPAIVSYADIFYSVETVRALAASRRDVAITYDPDWLTLWSQRSNDPLSDAETFALDGDRVIDIGRRATAVDEIRGQYMGLLRFTPAGWQAVDAALAEMTPDRRDRLDMTGLLARLIERGVFVEGVPKVGPWGEVDNADDLELYERLIATRQGS